MEEIERSTAVELGYHLPGGPLIEQAIATKAIAVVDMPRFKAEGILDETAITNLDALVAKVHEGLASRASATEEARAQTAGQATAVRDMKVKRRRLDRSVARVFRRKPELLEQYRVHSNRGLGLAGTCNDMNLKLTFAKDHAADLGPVGVTAVFLAQLEADIRALENATGNQDATITQLPGSNRDYCEAKGRLYDAIKDINYAGHALHADDLEAASKYNAKILYQRRTRGRATPASPTTPTTPTGTTTK